MTATVNRRTLIGGAATLAVSLGLPDAVAQAGAGGDDGLLSPAQPFSFEALKARAKALAAQPYAAPVIPSRAVLEDITYDQYQRIRYRADKTLKPGGDGRSPVQFFHLGKYAQEPVKMHVVDGGVAREVIFRPELFDIPEGHPARQLPAGSGFAGFRIMAPDLKTDWFAAMGASYFRTSGLAAVAEPRSWSGPRAGTGQAR